MTYLYLDTETLGLDHQHIWEIAFAFDDEPVESRIVWHTLDHADSEAMKVNGYRERCGKIPHYQESMAWELEHFASRIEETQPTIVGANPSFDTQRLLSRWGTFPSEAPWHYRHIDIESYAMAIFDWPKPRGLYTIAEELRAMRWKRDPVRLPDHTAAGDVECLRECFALLRGMSGWRWV